MKNITYLLGAGASYEALPLVNNWEERINKYINFLNIIKIKSNLNTNWNLKHIDTIIAKYTELIKEATDHQTMDTFAKKLYLKNREKDLWFLKNLIGGFFELEQYEKTERDIKLHNFQSEGKRLDSRYDAFFAALLEKSGQSLSFNKKINILSWNYDSQIELAYSNFTDCTISEAREKLHLHPKEDEFLLKRNYELDNSLIDSPRIIKINGSADLSFSRKNEKTVSLIYHSTTNSSFSTIAYKKVYEHLFYADKYLEEREQKRTYNLCFSWERKSDLYQDALLNKAKELISNSTVLVVIGYSFPIFNRKIDKLILEGSDLDKIYIQVPSKDYEGYKTRIKGLINFPDEKFHPIAELRQFYIPFELQ